MEVVTDFHVHSKYAYATSKNSNLENNSAWAKIKGIDILATGDITHPLWFEELKEKLVDLNNGLFEFNGIKFILNGEVSLIYRLNGKVKKMHLILSMPSFEIAAQVNEQLKKYGKLGSDGRPTLLIGPKELMDILISISKDIFVILAHVWTPWFSVFGSKSGVDSIEEAFGERSSFIGALETGLSSDPLMNWMLSSLDKYTLVSNSDAHSPQKLGREGNLLDLEEVSYDSIFRAIKNKKGFSKTYEFFPEEGKYHYDGHRKCNIIMNPKESLKNNNICPVCKKSLTIGVMNRVYELADREHGFKPENSVNFQHIVPLPTLISKVIKKGENTKSVQSEYMRLIKGIGSEFGVYEANLEQLRKVTTTPIATAIDKVNRGEVDWIPGYDGVFGELKLGKL